MSPLTTPACTNGADCGPVTLLRMIASPSDPAAKPYRVA
jgi:hypothetical protein